MKDNKNGGIDLISASIHSDFYFNRYLDAPTLIKVYPEVEKILSKSKYLACITIRVSQLQNIEYLYGSIVYNNLLTRVNHVLKEVRKDAFRNEDIFLVDLHDVDTFVIFLSAPRKKETQLLNHLESIAERTRIRIERQLFDIFYPYTKHYQRPAIGFALVINNPMISNMRLVMQVLNNSIRMGEFLVSRNDYTSKFHLQKVILEESVDTVFQPIVDMRTLKVFGYEALSRGPGDSEFLNPLLMFTFASDFGLSFELDTVCRKKVFERARKLRTGKKIFVNTLTMTIHDPEFRGAYLENLLKDMKIKPENVIFEINEKLAIDNYDLFRSSMRDYQDIGIVHASDDIGTGYADLEKIMELNPGYMKIDISLVRDIHKNYIKQEMIKAMVALAENLGSLVIAEGIETQDEFETLRFLNVSYGQGYFFGRPSENLDYTPPRLKDSRKAAPKKSPPAKRPAKV